MMSPVKTTLSFSILVLAFLFLLPFVTACGNDGPIAPGSPGWEELYGSDVLAPSIDDPQDGTDSLSPVKRHDDPTDDQSAPLAPASGGGTGSLNELASAMVYLRDSGGGVLTIPLDPDQFAVHVWDARTKENLHAQAVIVCSGGPTSLVNISGMAAYQNATFPLTITVRVEGYALETIAETNANVLSLAMTAAAETGQARLFGVGQSLGCEKMQIYTDTLLPEIYNEPSSAINPDYMQYELAIESGRQFGYSVFMFGGIDIGDTGVDNPLHASPIFWLVSYFDWEVKALEAGENRYHAIIFDGKDGPAGVDDGVARVPSAIWDQKDDILKYGRIVALPTAILLDTRQYLAMGPHVQLDGTDPDDIKYSAPYYEPAVTPERYVMAGQILMPDGGIDIVHRDWHPGSDSPDLDFSGIPVIGITGNFGGGVSYPVFAVTDPLGADSNLVKIEARAGGVRPAWSITLAGGTEFVDTSDFAVPLTWLEELFSTLNMVYRVECTNALSQDIDDFNDDMIIMNRRETCFSPWNLPEM